MTKYVYTFIFSNWTKNQLSHAKECCEALSLTFTYSFVHSLAHSCVCVFFEPILSLSFYFVTLFTFIHISFYTLFLFSSPLLCSFNTPRRRHPLLLLLLKFSYERFLLLLFVFVFLFCSTSFFPYSIALAPTSFAFFINPRHPPPSLHTHTHSHTLSVSLTLCPRSFARFVDIIRCWNIP